MNGLALGFLSGFFKGTTTFLGGLYKCTPGILGFGFEGLGSDLVWRFGGIPGKL